MLFRSVPYARTALAGSEGTFLPTVRRCIPLTDDLQVNGVPVPLENVPSLEVVVVATHLSLPPGEVFPVPGETVHHHDITRGRQGGSRTVQ